MQGYCKVKHLRLIRPELSLGLAIIFGLAIFPDYAMAAGPKASLRGPKASLRSTAIKNIKNKKKTPTYVIRKRVHPVLPKATPRPRPSSPTPIAFRLSPDGVAIFPTLPDLDYRFAGRVAGAGTARELIFYSLSPGLQDAAEELVRDAGAPHVAVVAMEPKTGRILALAQHSSTLPNAALHADFPAASLFKLTTSTAALDRNLLSPSSKIYFRGGDYTLNLNNYKPNPKQDHRVMTLTEGLGKSCNPVFARVALQQGLSPAILSQYARLFGFNSNLGFNVPLKSSTAKIPSGAYELARTAAGFGDVHISAVHAATLMSGIANEGMLPQPNMVDHIISANGALLYRAEPLYLQRMMRPTTARTLLGMMSYTTTNGTSKYAFAPGGKPVMPDIQVAAKTGTLRGSNPPGLNRLFIAAAPISNPKIAVAVVVVNAGIPSSRPSYIGRRLIQRYLEG